MRHKIGVVGGGQLGRMLGLAGIPLGMEFRFWDPAATPPAAAVGEMFHADFDDSAAAEAFASGQDIITYEFENIPAATIEALARVTPCHPGARSLATSQDRVHEKTFFNDNGIKTAPWRAVHTLAELRQAVEEFGPSILKTRRFGYDGKGQARIDSVADADRAWDALGQHPVILEQKIAFSRELSIIGVRSTTGEVDCWDLVENEHRHGILHKSVAPAPNVPEFIHTYAAEVIKTTMEALEHVGVLTIEFFQAGDALLANEMAPRVHNSGHWTIEGSVTSQFENHLRAIAGLPLGSCAARGRSVMINCIGALPDPDAVGRHAGAHFHDYGKTPRPGRKVGHVTLCEQPAAAAAFAEAVAHVENLCLTTSAPAAHA